MKPHHWSGWPGAYCLDCGCDDPLENALADNKEEEIIQNMKEHANKYACVGGSHPEHCGQCHAEQRRQV